METVCLDLMVGLPMVREPSPARCTGMRTEADIVASACGRAASTTNDEVRHRSIQSQHSAVVAFCPRCSFDRGNVGNFQARILETKFTQVSEENRRLTEMIAYLCANQSFARQSLE